MAETCRAAKPTIGGFQRAQLPSEAWPFLPASLRSILDYRGAALPPPRQVLPRSCQRQLLSWLRTGASPPDPNWKPADLYDHSAAGITRLHLRLSSLIYQAEAEVKNECRQQFRINRLEGLPARKPGCSPRAAGKDNVPFTRFPASPLHHSGCEKNV